MKYFIKDLISMRTDCVVNITVWDGFSGKVKIIKNRFFKWLVEIVDVSMCYPQQAQLNSGEKIWISKRDIFKERKKGKRENGETLF